jgi:hypothetical protein
MVSPDFVPRFWYHEVKGHMQDRASHPQHTRYLGRSHTAQEEKAYNAFMQKYDELVTRTIWNARFKEGPIDIEGAVVHGCCILDPNRDIKKVKNKWESCCCKCRIRIIQ